jgi:hypothetical protein
MMMMSVTTAAATGSVVWKSLSSVEQYLVSGQAENAFADGTATMGMLHHHHVTDSQGRCRLRPPLSPSGSGQVRYGNIRFVPHSMMVHVFAVVVVVVVVTLCAVVAVLLDRRSFLKFLLSLHGLFYSLVSH